MHGHAAHGLEVLEQVIRQRTLVRHDQVFARAPAKQHRIAIRFGARDVHAAGYRPPAGLVDHDQRLRKILRRDLSDRAREHIGRAAGAVRHDKLNRLFRVSGRGVCRDRDKCKGGDQRRSDDLVHERLLSDV